MSVVVITAVFALPIEARRLGPLVCLWQWPGRVSCDYVCLAAVDYRVSSAGHTDSQFYSRDSSDVLASMVRLLVDFN